MVKVTGCMYWVYIIMLHKIVIIKLSYTETFLFAGFEEASCHIVSFPHHDEGCMSKN